MSLVIPRLRSDVPIVDEQGRPTPAFHQWWQLVAENIESSFTDLTDLVTQLADHQTQLDDQLAQILDVTTNDSITASYTAPGTILSAADAGTDATITIADHTRKYGDASQVAVTGADIPALAYSTKYYIYYDDETRAGGAVSFQATTNANTALPNKVKGRHYCGNITTPASGGTATNGGTTAPAGGGNIDRSEINSTL